MAERVKEFLESVFALEAEVAEMKDKTYFMEKPEELEVYNAKVVELNAHSEFALGATVPKLEDDENVLKMMRSQVFYPHDARFIFKISEYDHESFGKVWVAYISEPNPDPDFKVLAYAFFVVEKSDSLKVSRQYIYSDYESDGESFAWRAQFGLPELTFESLGALVNIERYEEPEDFEDGLSIYYDNI